MSMFFYKINIVLFFLLASQFCFAQNQNNVWYFGNRAGISFNNNVISTLNDGVLNHTEGVSSICDINGDLLFYTNGINIWNINNEPMPNGTGLLGNNSSAQVLILPKPGDCNIYYVFTTPPQGSEGGAYYSVIDMRKNNGRGDVVTKNIFLVELATERITATYKNNGVDYWVMLQELGSNGFLAFSVTAAGVNLTPIISFSGLPNALSDDVVGCMKFSKNGSKLCTANELGFKKCQLFDFNNTTGVVSNGFVLSDTEAYGVEFSDDDSKLYLCRYTGFKLTQYDLTSNNPVVIKNSETLIAIAPIAQNNNGGALQIGSDKKYMLLEIVKPI